jgi:hypothetical protein
LSDPWPSRPPSSPQGAPAAPPPGRIVAGALVGIAIVVIVAIAAAIVITDDDGPIIADLADTATTDAPGRSTVPGETTTAAPTDLDAAVDEAIAFIENERQRTFTTRPVVEALDDAAFVARFDALVDAAVADDPQGIDAANVVSRALGIITPDDDVIEIERSFGADLVLGFYDTEANELVVRGGAITLLFRNTLVHELTHALDDQLVELDRPEYEDADDEVSFGFSAVIEGNARRVEAAFYESLSRDDQRSLDAESASYGAGIDLGRYRRSYLVLTFAPYDLGEPFVAELLDSGGEDAVDAALRDPPRTSEQVLYFDAYVAREGRVEVAAPPADGEIVEDGVVGELGIVAILSDSMGIAEAREAADGWAGDWFVAWREGTASCLRAAFVMDTDNDREDLVDAFDEWVRDHDGDATVAEDGDRVLLTTCAG